jgi:hypothetical protein
MGNFYNRTWGCSMCKRLQFFIFFLMLLISTKAYAHKSSSSYPIYNYPAAGLSTPCLFPTKELLASSKISFNFNVGIGFLYFRKLKGNLSPIPTGLFSGFSGSNFGRIGNLGYNRTPLFEANIGYRLLPWIEMALTYNGQSGMSCESQPNSSIATGSSNNPTWASFRSNLQLNSVLLKFYFNSPSSLILGNFSFTPYLAAGIGAGWQSWTNICMYEMRIASGSFESTVLSLNQKISANVTWTCDVGLNIKPATPRAPFSLRAGCKYIDWGQARQMGILQQQGAKAGPFKPISVKRVDSFAPYIGVQFNF